MSTSTITSQAPGLWDQLHRAIRWARIALVVTAGLFLFMLASQGLWLYQQAASVNPWLGYAWLGFLAGGLVLVGMPAYRFLQVPLVVQPPEVPETGRLRIGHLRAEVRYLQKYLAVCRTNSELEPKIGEVERALSELGDLSRQLREGSESHVPDFDERLTEWTSSRMPAILADVDRKADQMIYQEALTVGLATAASPNGTLDAFMMLWRSVKLVSQLAVLYYGRPGLWGTLAICRDVSVATALAGYLQGVTDSLGGLLAKSLGGVTGVIAGPAIDGITNALVLIRIGYLAQERCRSYRKWDAKTRQSALMVSLAATQKVAIGLSTEILRQLGIGLGAAASAVVSGVGSAASVAGSAASAACESLGGLFGLKKEEAPPEG